MRAATVCRRTHTYLNGHQATATGRVPHPNSAVPGPTGEQLAIGRPRQGPHQRRVSLRTYGMRGACCTVCVEHVARFVKHRRRWHTVPYAGPPDDHFQQLSGWCTPLPRQQHCASVPNCPYRANPTLRTFTAFCAAAGPPRPPVRCRSDQTRSVLSLLPLASLLPSPDQAKHVTMPVCPWVSKEEVNCAFGLVRFGVASGVAFGFED